MGTPAVMGKGSTAAEIIHDRENGFLCENDPKDLARVISGVLEDPDLLARAGEKARETIPVPWETIMETVVERYTRLVALGKEGKLKDKRIRIV